MRDVSTSQPLLSFAVPVRNAAEHLPRLLASLRAQDEPDIEIVVCDNCSTDDTQQIVLAAAAQDSRVRYARNDHDIGQIANFNRVLELSRGRYVRWIGADDWLEPSYARRCIEALDAAPHAIVVTTYQDHIRADGARFYAEYEGERLESADPARRFRRMLWFCTADYRYIDPIYSTMRRSALERTRRLLVVPNMDQVLASELALKGPFVHVPECLAHRSIEHPDSHELVRRYHPVRYRELDERRHLDDTLRAMWEPVERAELGVADRATCAVAIARYAGACTRRSYVPRLRRQARHALERVSPDLLDALLRTRSLVRNGGGA